MTDADFCGLVLAAGAGSRFGGPKVLAQDTDGVPWVHRAIAMLRAGGCAEVLVTVGAQAPAALEIVADRAIPVAVDDWAEGVAASLRVGLAAASRTGARAVVIVPVDTPAMPAAAVVRLLASAAEDRDAGLAQAVYGGRPGHPVIIGRAHWAAVAASAHGDRGAGPYLVAHGAARIECGDLWSGEDVDARS